MGGRLGPIPPRCPPFGGTSRPSPFPRTREDVGWKHGLDGDRFLLPERLIEEDPGRVLTGLIKHTLKEVALVHA
jgi:hypothetical protein